MLKTRGQGSGIGCETWVIDITCFSLYILENSIVIYIIKSIEPLEKCFPLKAGFKYKEGDPACSGINRRNILNILRIYPPLED
jgi:hypothetical protein